MHPNVRAILQHGVASVTKLSDGYYKVNVKNRPSLLIRYSTGCSDELAFAHVQHVETGEDYKFYFDTIEFELVKFIVESYGWKEYNNGNV